MSEDLTALAADAYVYGFPLVTNLREVKKFTRDGLGSLPPAPFNGFSHATALARPAERFVSVNNDTAYRYSIGDRTPGLRRAADGSLTIVMQHDEPSEPERRANWLPTPAGAFRPILRMYEPDDAVFNGSYELPAITRVA